MIGTVEVNQIGTVSPDLLLTQDSLAQPTVMAMVNVPTPTPGPPPQTYTLQAGEFPFCIARRFNVSVANLLRLNNIGGVVSPGQTLKIPQDGVPFGGPRALLPHPTTYTVKAGETIYQVACAFGDVDPLYIAMANKLQAPYSLTPGQVLQIP
jgi:LysM repeat protein